MIETIHANGDGVEDVGVVHRSNADAHLSEDADGPHENPVRKEIEIEIEIETREGEMVIVIVIVKVNVV